MEQIHANKKEAQQLVNFLKLQQHPEGGYSKETYRSEDKTVFPEKFGVTGTHNCATCIYYGN